jgi:hypothetical protein
MRLGGAQVSLLLAFKAQLDLTLREAFGWGGHLEPFKVALKDSLEVAANSRPASAHGKTLAELMGTECLPSLYWSIGRAASNNRCLHCNWHFFVFLALFMNCFSYATCSFGLSFVLCSGVL